MMLSDSGKIVRGTAEPRIQLTAKQQNSVVAFVGVDGKPFCTGIAIRPWIILTAAHCPIEVGDAVRTGADVAGSLSASDARVTEVATNPNWNSTFGDHRLVRLNRSLDVTVLPLYSGIVTVGMPLTAVGYGLTAAGADAQSRRWWLAETVEEAATGAFSVDGEGVHGLCFGDSGGPALVGSGASWAVAGTVSQGDVSCVGDDTFSAVKMQLPWMQSILKNWTSPGSLNSSLWPLILGSISIGLVVGLLSRKRK